MPKRLSKTLYRAFVTGTLCAAIGVGCSNASTSDPKPPANLIRAEWDPAINCEKDRNFTLPDQSPPVDFDKEMVIRDLRVVNDSCRTTWGGCASPSQGKWTAGYLLWQLAGGLGADPNDVSTKLFVKSWLSTWLQDQPVTVAQGISSTAKARPLMYDKFICPWYLSSTGEPSCPKPTDWTKLDWTKLDMKKAPFRLLAIVNRLDMASREGGSSYSGGSGSGSPGEARFVFGFLGAPDAMKEPTVLQGTVIFEYMITDPHGENATQLANLWHGLSNPTLSDLDYNNYLEALTGPFTKFPSSSKTHQGTVSMIRQVRTNEKFSDTAGKVWEFREFHQNADDTKAVLSATGEYIYPLQPAPLKQSLDLKYNGSTELCAYLTDPKIADDILNESQTIPAAYAAVVSSIDSDKASSIFWTADDTCWENVLATEWPLPRRQQVRHRFALGTCTGCHYHETGTAQFHITTRPPKGIAPLSPFLMAGTSGTGDYSAVDIEPGYSVYFNERYRRTCELRRVIVGTLLTAKFKPSGASPH